MAYSVNLRWIGRSPDVYYWKTGSYFAHSHSNDILNKLVSDLKSEV